MRPLIHAKNLGFTLIEMAISITIVGIFLAAAVEPYSLYLKRQAIDTTTGNVAAVTAAIGNYRMLNGYYPCPASSTATSGDPAYGHQSLCTDTSIAPGSCSNGICVRLSNRSVTYTPTGTPVIPPFTENPRVRMGAIPFRELNLDESQAYDGYGNRINYAVTERLAVSNTFQPDGGGIGILNDQGQSTLAVADSAHFMIFSSGEDEAGAYNRNGVLVSPCPAAGLESKNCAVTLAAVYQSAQSNHAGGARQFDDVISYFTQADLPLWQYSPNKTDIHEKPNGNVGAAYTTGTAQTMVYKTQIPGSANISSDLMTQNICDANGANCFSSSLIAGPVAPAGTALTCPPGQFLVKIDHSTARCQAEVYASCPSGKALTGLNADGTLICGAPPPSCVAATQTICGAQQTLQPTANNGKVTLRGGDSFAETYTCTNGNWSSGTSSGVCTCTPQAAESKTVACAAGFTGNQLVTRTYTCPAGKWSGYVNSGANTCTCANTTQTTTQACQTGYTGIITLQSTHVCAGAGAPYWTPPGIVSNTCVCTPQHATQTVACTGGLTGTGTVQSRDFTCPDATWTNWTNVSSDCSCTPVTNTRTQACAPGYVGNGTPQQNVFQCPSATWTGWTNTGPSDCQPAPPVICHWSSSSSSQLGAIGIGPALGSECTCGKTGQCSAQQGGNLYQNYNSCVCQ